MIEVNDISFQIKILIETIIFVLLYCNVIQLLACLKITQKISFYNFASEASYVTFEIQILNRYNFNAILFNISMSYLHKINHFLPTKKQLLRIIPKNDTFMSILTHYEYPFTLKVHIEFFEAMGCH